MALTPTFTDTLQISESHIFGSNEENGEVLVLQIEAECESAVVVEMSLVLLRPAVQLLLNKKFKLNQMEKLKSAAEFYTDSVRLPLVARRNTP